MTPLQVDPPGYLKAHVCQDRGGSTGGDGSKSLCPAVGGGIRGECLPAGAGLVMSFYRSV